MNVVAQTIRLDFIDKLKFLFEPARYKIAYGGRGGGKTIAFAQAALVLGSKKPLRIGCFREFQKSIKESVHETLRQEIDRLQLVNDEGKPFYTVKDTSIEGVNGTEFFFMGLRHNLNSIRSIAGIEIAWIEEAAPISKMAWDIFEPTIRMDAPYGPFGEGSEIWIGFNPELDTDETFKRFVLNPPEGAIVEKVNYSDNKFFPEILRKQMEDSRRRSELDYLTVWEGHCRQTLNGAIFAEEIIAATKENRITEVPYIAGKPVHTFWDLGYRDYTCIWFIQQVGNTFNVIDYYQNSQQKIPHYLKVLQEKPYVYGNDYLPHDGRHERVDNNSASKQMRDANRKVRLVERVPKKALAINSARTIFPSCYFDAAKTALGLQSLRRYRYDVDENNQFSREPLHDENSHAADAFMTFARSLKTEREDVRPSPIKVHPRIISQNFRTQSAGWMR